MPFVADSGTRSAGGGLGCRNRRSGDALDCVELELQAGGACMTADPPGFDADQARTADKTPVPRPAVNTLPLVQKCPELVHMSVQTCQTLRFFIPSYSLALSWFTVLISAPTYSS